MDMFSVLLIKQCYLTGPRRHFFLMMDPNLRNKIPRRNLWQQSLLTFYKLLKTWVLSQVLGQDGGEILCDILCLYYGIGLSFRYVDHGPKIQSSPNSTIPSASMLLLKSSLGVALQSDVQMKTPPSVLLTAPLPVLISFCLPAYLLVVRYFFKLFLVSFVPT